MSVNQLKWAQNGRAVKWLYLGCKSAVFCTVTQLGQFVNASADLTRSLGLQNFTIASFANMHGQEEQ